MNARTITRRERIVVAPEPSWWMRVWLWLSRARLLRKMKHPTKSATWWADIDTKVPHVIAGHSFEITHMGPDGLVLKYDNSNRAASRRMTRRAGE